MCKTVNAKLDNGICAELLKLIKIKGGGLKFNAPDHMLRPDQSRIQLVNISDVYQQLRIRGD